MSEKTTKKSMEERVAELAMRVGWKHLADYGSVRSRHDFTKRQLMAKAGEATLPAKLYADAGYDAKWVHDQCRLDWGAESVIKPAKQRLWFTLGDGIVFQRAETDDGFDAD
jgi:hypothetical protein